MAIAISAGIDTQRAFSLNPLLFYAFAIGLSAAASPEGGKYLRLTLLKESLIALTGTRRSELRPGGISEFEIEEQAAAGCCGRSWLTRKWSFKMKKAFAITAAVAAAMTMSSAATAATDVIATTNANVGNWSVETSGGASEVTVFTPSNIPGTWAPNDANSVWLSPTPNPGNLQAPGQSFPAGNLSFIGTFELSNIADVQTWAITWWADNILRRIFVNGTELTSPALPTGGANSQQFVGAGISRVFNQSVFVNGTNTIEFVVENGTGSVGNPAGFRLFSTLTTVPEPGTWMLMILGLGAVGFAMRRRQNASVRLQFA